ncbi:lysozyme inhibitor LprI family protein [Bacillus sp. FJAT-27231]|uniref:lysozyme inhibitor LprI family protein n=1 Tax=Bacillus sp. FJAT-27231 TaxID=1679168 RepID=UPI0006714390|nr:lysozyme inhibitor LprI family protein [Bacillus sp. FJAT-27231]
MKRAARVVVAAILLAGCNNGTYEKAMEQGKLALANGEFDKAQASFELALDEKPKDEKAKGLYEDLTAYHEVEKAIEEAKWEDALTKANHLLQEDHLADSLKKELEEYVKTAESHDEESSEVAKKLEEIKSSIGQGNYSDAQTSINELKQNEETATALSGFSDEVKSIEESINERLQKQKAAEALEEKERARAEAAVSKKEEYLQKLYNIEAGMSDLTYIYEHGTTVEMREAEAAAYKKWDDALNDIYSVLKTQLSSSEMTNLRGKQREWIKYRDRTAKAESATYEGGSFASVQYVSTQARLTRERCYELVNIYMR